MSTNRMLTVFVLGKLSMYYVRKISEILSVWKFFLSLNLILYKKIKRIKIIDKSFRLHLMLIYL